MLGVHLELQVVQQTRPDGIEARVRLVEHHDVR